MKACLWLSRFCTHASCRCMAHALRAAPLLLQLLKGVFYPRTQLLLICLKTLCPLVYSHYNALGLNERKPAYVPEQSDAGDAIQTISFCGPIDGLRVLALAEECRVLIEWIHTRYSLTGKSFERLGTVPPPKASGSIVSPGTKPCRLSIASILGLMTATPKISNSTAPIARATTRIRSPNCRKARAPKPLRSLTSTIPARSRLPVRCTKPSVGSPPVVDKAKGTASPAKKDRRSLLFSPSALRARLVSV